MMDDCAQLLPAVESFSEEDDDYEEHEDGVASMSGTLYKWTNYIHGWQPRYFLLQNGTLAYYKSEVESGFGCRGAVPVEKALIQAHEFDDSRFEVCVNDNIWYLKADSSEERQNWLDILEAYKLDSGYGSQNDLRRHGSVVSLTSNRSMTSTSSFKSLRSLQEKLAELETFRDIVCHQIESLQGYFDACAFSATSNNPGMNKKYASEIDAVCEDFPYLSEDEEKRSVGIPAVDFKGEALTFKATTAGILTTLQHCIELVQQREDSWRKRLEKEVERRKKTEELYKSSLAVIEKQKSLIVYGGPDFEEGPNSALNEEEWHDAVDAALDKEDIEDNRIDRLTLEQLAYAKAGVADGVWQLFAEDGEMKMFKREEEIDGAVIDPLKAVHSVKGVTAHEYCHYFFAPQYKLDWDSTLEDMKVVERVSEDTIIIHQFHKRVWPANQRESLFWTHIRRVDTMKDPEANDLYIVCNHHIERDDVPVNTNCLRVGLTIAMVCQTIINSEGNGETVLSDVKREDLTCKIVYVAQVNPGGWAPASALRLVYKREYPKFLKLFTQYVLQKTSEQTAIKF